VTMCLHVGCQRGVCTREPDDATRLDRIETMLAARGFHEESCPVREAQVANAEGMWYVKPGECDCWLSTTDG
jgi:hypothetical protein